MLKQNEDLKKKMLKQYEDLKKMLKQNEDEKMLKQNEDLKKIKTKQSLDESLNSLECVQTISYKISYS